MTQEEFKKSWIRESVNQGGLPVDVQEIEILDIAKGQEHVA